LLLLDKDDSLYCELAEEACSYQEMLAEVKNRRLHQQQQLSVHAPH
jgi:hypothetical protein